MKILTFVLLICITNIFSSATTGKVELFDPEVHKGEDVLNADLEVVAEKLRFLNKAPEPEEEEDMGFSLFD